MPIRDVLDFMLQPNRLAVYAVVHVVLRGFSHLEVAAF